MMMFFLQNRGMPNKFELLSVFSVTILSLFRDHRVLERRTRLPI